MIKYVLRPGFVASRNDLQSHFISYGKLIKLYGLNPAECTMYSPRRCANKGLIYLYPSHSGDYNIKGNKS